MSLVNWSFSIVPLNFVEGVLDGIDGVAGDFMSDLLLLGECVSLDSILSLVLDGLVENLLELLDGGQIFFGLWHFLVLLDLSKSHHSLLFSTLLLCFDDGHFFDELELILDS